MTATAEEVRRLRRIIAEDSSATYNDAELRAYIERYPLVDALGNDPWEVDSTTNPVTLEVNDDWTPTYDLNAAAADIWSEKAAALVTEFDFSAGGQSFQRSQAYLAMMSQARYYRSRRAAQTIRQQTTPKPETDTLSN